MLLAYPDRVTIVCRPIKGPLKFLTAEHYALAFKFGNTTMLSEFQARGNGKGQLLLRPITAVELAAEYTVEEEVSAWNEIRLAWEQSQQYAGQVMRYDVWDLNCETIARLLLGRKPESRQVLRVVCIACVVGFVAVCFLGWLCCRPTAKAATTV